MRLRCGRGVWARRRPVTESGAPSSADERLAALVEAGSVVASGLDLDAVLERLLDLARALTGARYAAVGVLDASGERIERFVTVGVSAQERAAIGDPPVGRGILGALISDPRPLRLADLARDPRAAGFPPAHPPMRSFLGVPVVAGDAVFGNLYLTGSAGGEFSAEDERLIVTLAGHAGVAVQNARLYRQARERAEELEGAVRELSSIHDIADAVLAGGPRDDTLRLVCERAREALRCRLVYIALPGGAGGDLRIVAASGEGAGRLAGVGVPTAESKVGTAMRARRTVIVDDLRADSDAHQPTVAILGITRQVIVPLVHRGEAIGAITAGEDGDGRPLTDDDVRILQSYATRAVLAVVIARVLDAERERVAAEGRLRAAELRAAERRETLRRVVDAQEHERRRIARELHDETGQALTSVLLGLRLIEETSPAVRAAVAELRETIANAIQELRALAVELRPKALDDFGLAAAIERLADTYARRTGIVIDVHVAGLDTRLPGEIETALYRIVQESLTNVAKHAGAATASVTVHRVPGSVTAVIEDDGRGFDPAVITPGLGLGSMLERAELVSGTVRIESRPDGGTTIAVEVPL
jgi:two-component system, NarL family, sensor histidine kinase DevS